MTPTTEVGRSKRRLAFAAATALGLGNLPKAPGTFGSLGGLALAWCAVMIGQRRLVPLPATAWNQPTQWWMGFLIADGALALVVSAIGVWAASQVAIYLGKEDPQIVVIDEVAGQLIACVGLVVRPSLGANWKYLLMGFILFRVFDIWKPFPARQAESLSGGLGIMADDWIAGVYAALVLGFARYLGL